jgi:quinoprotein glucose dehydrogenase/quinate dehydrogenase (quinone)
MAKFGSRVLAIILLLIGLAVGAGGAWLIVLGGSPYYLLGGIAVGLSGFWLWRSNQRAGWLYAAFLIATCLWALWEVGLDGWQLTARIIGPALFGLFFALPGIRRQIGQGGGWAAAAAGLLGFLLVFGAAMQSPMEVAATKTPEVRTVQTPGKDNEWSAWARDNAGTHFSPLTQITPDNVGKLQLAWEFDTGYDPMTDPAPSPLQATPLMVDGRLFLCTQTNVVFAVDPETGKELWRYDPKVNSEGGTAVRTCRGVAYYESTAAMAAQPQPAAGVTPAVVPFCAHRIITGTFAAQLVALDSATGKPCPGFGNNGIVDLKEGMGEVLPGYYHTSSAPTIVRGTIVIGGWVSDNMSTDEPSGVIRGFDAETGKLRWAWDAGNPANSKGAPAGKWYTRSTPNSWAPMSGDEELGLVYVPTGNPAPDYFGGFRSKESDKFGSSVIALDATTGELRWNFQTAHHDLWDYDVASQPTLFNFPGKNGPIPALAQPTKRGELFVLDRRTGKPLTQVVEKPVPQNGKVPEERLSPTQPFSTGMPSFAGGRLTEKDMWGITPIDQLFCRIWFKRLRYDGPLTPPGLTEAIVYPSIGGGMNWGGVSFDPDRRVMIVNSLYYASLVSLIPRAEADRLIEEAGKAGDSHDLALAHAPLPMTGAPYGARVRGFTSPLNTLCHAPPYGRMAAVDMDTQKILWERPVGTTRDSGPLGLKIGLPIRMGMPGFGGTLATRSGLIFFGAQKERTFRAFDTTTGKELWSTRMPASGNANPMTYLGPKSGRQFVVVAASGHVTSQSMPLGRTFRAYALPKEK